MLEPSMTTRRWDSQRVYVTLIFVPLFYVLVRHAPPAAFFALTLGSALLAVAEFYRLHFRGEGLPGAVMTLGFSATALILGSFQWPFIVSERTIVLAVVIGALLYRLCARRTMAEGLTDPAIVAFGPLYIGLCLGHLLLTRAMPDGEFLIFGLVLVTWAADAGAYYLGMSVGRHKLAPAISPNKTVEGLVGGLIAATLAAFFAHAWFLPALTAVDCVTLAGLLTAAGLLGDLVESAMKRGAGVKDSGTLIPGHGGMLDRLDSLLFTAPTFYYYVAFVKG
jgi:phosphatidate cytidylyltransferase